LHNTLINTGGISVRFVESSANVQGNLVDGLIRTRDGGLLRAADNFDTSASRLYLGVYPVRNLYVNAAAMVFTWSRKTTSPRCHGYCCARLMRGTSIATSDLWSYCGFFGLSYNK
jgi:hypothetical protein